jgi:sporulation protein YlmC with PRC-barrel domain
MLKRLMISTAAAALVAGSAIAQQPPPADKSPPPAKSPPAQVQKDMPKADAGSRQFVTQQASDQWLASKFRGTDVIGTNNEKIGDVNDILFDRNGRIMAYVIGVGGFLGIGSKDVALAPNAFQVESDRNEFKLKLTMTRDELKNAPEFKAASDRPAAPTTGQRDRAPAERAPATPPASPK